jgi:hypothetical protein
VTKVIRKLATWALLAALASHARPPAAAAQSVALRTPNLIGGWIASPGVVQLNLIHRFSLSDAPLRKLTNTPTHQLGTGVTDELMVGLTYGSNSSLVPAYPNEWEFFARARLLEQQARAPLDLYLQGGYNVASESVDGEVVVARSFHRLRLLVAARAFSRAYDGDEARYAVHGGAVLNLTRSISVASDYGLLLDRHGDEPVAWGVGLQMGVPYTPHSLSLHASNVGTASLEGASRGSRTRWGFEYTIPINVRRYLPGGDGGGDEEQ